MGNYSKFKVCLEIEVPGDHDNMDLYRYIKTRNGAAVGIDQISLLSKRKTKPQKLPKSKARDNMGLVRKFLKDIFGSAFKIKLSSNGSNGELEVVLHRHPHGVCRWEFPSSRFVYKDACFRHKGISYELADPNSESLRESVIADILGASYYGDSRGRVEEILRTLLKEGNFPKSKFMERALLLYELLFNEVIFRHLSESYVAADYTGIKREGDVAVAKVDVGGRMATLRWGEDVSMVVAGKRLKTADKIIAYLNDSIGPISSEYEEIRRSREPILLGKS